jgi:hypothetical protein
LSFYEGVGVLKIKELESEVLKIEESELELLCTDSTALTVKVGICALCRILTSATEQVCYVDIPAILNLKFIAPQGNDGNDCS